MVIQILVCTLMGNTRQRLLTTQSPTPFVPGTYAIGRVFSIGSDTTALPIGTLVLINSLITARDDPTTRFLFGREQEHPPKANALISAPWRDATWARYAKCPLENIHALDEHRLCHDLGHALPDLTWLEPCAVAYAGLRDAGTQPGDRVVIAPATGRYGAAAVAVALSLGAAQVVAAGRDAGTLRALCDGFGRPRALAAAVMRGDAGGDGAALAAVLRGREADVVVDFSPGRAGEGGRTPSHLAAGIAALRVGGTCCLMGGVAGEVRVPYRRIMTGNIRLVGRYWCGREHIQQVIKLAEGGKLLMGADIGMENVGTYGLEDIDKALDHAERAYSATGWRGCVHILPQS